MEHEVFGLHVFIFRPLQSDEWMRITFQEFLLCLNCFTVAAIIQMSLRVPQRRKIDQFFHDYNQVIKIHCLRAQRLPLCVKTDLRLHSEGIA
jgi:hypothetical protein